MTRCDHDPCLDSDTGCERAQLGVEDDAQTATCFTIEQRAFGNGHAKHFLKAQALCAKLYFVGTVCLGLAALVFHGERDRPMKLDRIRLARKAVRKRSQHQPAHRPHTGARIRPAPVDTLVEQISRRSMDYMQQVLANIAG